jgi:putative zinc finger protein
MTCHDARELFSALIDETLTREERADVYGHLATCAECRRELAAVERTVTLVRGTTPARAPAGFVDRVMATVRPTPWYVRAGRALVLPWPIKLPLGAAAVLLIAGLAVLMFRGSQPQQRASQYETTPPVLADRRVTEPPASVPAGPPAAPATPTTPTAPARPPRDAASSDRAGSTREEDRTAAVASRVDQAEKRAETEKPDAARVETFSGARAPAPTMQSAPPAATDTALAKREAPAPHVIARLSAPDRDAAERALAALAARLGGAVTGRRLEGDTPVVELIIPRERYEDFAREAARFGVFRIESEAPAPADILRIAIRLAA